MRRNHYSKPALYRQKKGWIRILKDLLGIDRRKFFQAYTLLITFTCQVQTHLSVQDSAFEVSRSVTKSYSCPKNHIHSLHAWRYKCTEQADAKAHGTYTSVQDQAAWKRFACAPWSDCSQPVSLCSQITQLMLRVKSLGIVSVHRLTANQVWVQTKEARMTCGDNTVALCSIIHLGTH